MVSNDELWIDKALKLAQQAKEDGELPFGAVIISSQGKIIGQGRCREKKLATVFAHAETEAISRACQKRKTTDLSDCVMYCTSEPCVMCAAAIFQTKIARIVIGASRDDIGILRPRKINIDSLAKDSGYQIKIVRNVRKDEVIGLFKN